MKLQGLIMAALISGGAMLSAGDNVLKSTGFEPDACGEFGYWSIGQHDVEATLLPGAGVNGKNALRLKFNIMEFFSHLGIKSVPGSKYRIGGYVRTKDFSSPKGACFMLLDPSACYWRLKTPVFPENTNGEWVKVEKLVTLPKSRGASCHFAVFAPGSTGTLEISDPFVIPVDEKGEEKTTIAPPELYTYKRVVPVMPVLNRINAAKPDMHFTVYYPVNGKHDDYELEVSHGGQTGRFPLDYQHNVFASLPEVAPGGYRLELTLRQKSDGAAVLHNSYPCVAVRPMEKVAGKALNNLVTELASFDVTGDMEYEFTVPRDGWIFLGFDRAEKQVKVFLDNSKIPVIIHRDGENLETMRFMDAGKHRLRITGIKEKNRLHIRTVKQLQLFPFNVYEKQDLAMFRYDMDFFRKNLWPAVNTQFWQFERSLSAKNMAEARARGIRLINSGNANWSDSEAVERSVRTERDIEIFDGRALDEIGYWHSFRNQLSVAEALFRLSNFDKSVYLWMAKTRGHLFYPMIHRPLLSAASNAGGGRGKLIMETYISSSKNAEEVEKYMMLLNHHVRYAEKCIPDAKSRLSFMMSGYISAGAWNINIYPESDIKYSMDYFFWKFATDPELEGIFGIGCYDINNCDEERVRWIGKLMRHYCVEGSTDRLAEKYGINCNPGHLKNCDFDSKFQHWNAVPAEPGTLEPWYRRYYGALKQMRQGETGGLGDHAALFIRSKKAPNKLSQTAVNLIPGRKYSLCFVTADPEDVAQTKAKKDSFIFNVDISDAEIVPELGYIFKKPVGWESYAGKRAQICNHKVVFIPRKSEVMITFYDWQSDKEPGEASGSKRILNFVNLTPYFE